MGGHSKRVFIDLTEDDDDPVTEQPHRKVARNPLSEIQQLPNVWNYDDEDDEAANEIFANGSQEANNTGVGFVQVGAIGV